jgi:hypothetical protein
LTAENATIRFAAPVKENDWETNEKENERRQLTAENATIRFAAPVRENDW